MSLECNPCCTAILPPDKTLNPDLDFLKVGYCLAKELEDPSIIRGVRRSIVLSTPDYLISHRSVIRVRMSEHPITCVIWRDYWVISDYVGQRSASYARKTR